MLECCAPNISLGVAKTYFGFIILFNVYCLFNALDWITKKKQDMIDDALLRPGRLEVHVEIGLPDEAGRMQILTIHTRGMVRLSWLLSRGL